MKSNEELFLTLINSSIDPLTIKDIQIKTGIPRTTVIRYCDKFNYTPLKQKGPWNKGLNKENNKSIQLISKKLSGRKNGPRTKEEKNKISNSMKSNPNSGGFREFGGRGTKHIYRDIIFNSDSSFGVAKMLDKEDIEWEQPLDGFNYIDKNGDTKLVYLDFYLPDYDLYLAVKTNITTTVREKLIKIKNNHHIKILIIDELIYRRFMYNNIKPIIELY